MLRKSFVLFLLIGLLSFSLLSCRDSDDESEKGTADGSDQSQTDDDNEEKADDGEDESDKDNSDSTIEGEDDANSEDGESNSENKDDLTTDVDVVSFVYSINSNKYHLPSCYHVGAMKEDTKVEFSGTLEEFKAKELEPCKSCKPDPDYDYESDNNEHFDEEPEGYNYIINSNSKVFHNPDCSSVASMNSENKQYSYETREELLPEYSPCKNCNP
jgi:hypothetical protein